MLPPSWKAQFRRWPERFAQIYQERWQTQAEAARALGYTQGSISGWLKPYGGGGRYETDQKKTPRLDDLVDLADRLKISAPWLIFGIGQPTQSVPSTGQDSATSGTMVAIMGRVDREVVEPEFDEVPNSGFDTIELPFRMPDSVIGFAVTGVHPCYRQGDILLVFREQRFPTDAYVGDEVIVRVEGGGRYIKELWRGSKKHLWTLQSRIGYRIEDVRVSWVGEIFCVWKAPKPRNRRLSSPHIDQMIQLQQVHLPQGRRSTLR